MAAFVLTDAFVSINTVDLSDHVLSVTINYGAELQEDTSMGDSTKTRLPGLLDWSVEINFKQDFASAKVDATLFPLVGAAAFAVVFRPDNASGVGAANPNFTGTALLESYPPLSNAIGELAQASITLQGSGTLTRAEA